MERRLKSHPYTAWQLLKVYWQSEQRLLAYVFLVSVIIMTIGIVGMELLLNFWSNHFYNALQDYDKQSAFDLVWVFMFLAAIFIILAVYRYYLQSMLALKWRRWMTGQFLSRWLEKKSYYYLETFDESTDNPDQRIQEDINSMVIYSLDLTVGLINSITTLFAFIYVLWKLSGPVTVPLGPLGSVVIPAYLVWVGIIYAVVGTFFTFKIGRPLVNLNFEQQRREADFRFAAVDLRSHSENVALYRGEHHQKNVLSRLFTKVLDNWYMIILRQKSLLWFTAGYNQVSVILPLVVVLPNYFGKVFKLGGLYQALRAFTQVQEALSFLVSSYLKIAEWRAVLRRLLTFLNHMNEVEEKATIHNNFKFSEIPQHKIIVSDVSINTPLGEKLLEHINEELVHGQHYLIKGMSGIGKSTFVRTVAGIWPYGAGKIQLPNDQYIMYLPQKSYMPLGTLKDALLFPDNISMQSDDVIIQLLRECGLPDLAIRLNEVAMWSLQLSPGEQQRIAFARVLIHKPDWVFLDESTSALDLESEKNVYQLLKSKLPNCSLVSVGHRPSLETYHEHQIDLTKYSLEAADQKSLV